LYRVSQGRARDKNQVSGPEFGQHSDTRGREKKEVPRVEARHWLGGKIRTHTWCPLAALGRRCSGLRRVFPEDEQEGKEILEELRIWDEG
jgi:hypothetical protein